MAISPIHDKLRQLVGHQFDFLDEVWILIEVLADDDSLVLRRCRDCTPRAVQRNAYGIPTRRVSNELTLPISDDSGDGYSQDVLLLLEGHRPQSAG